MLTKLKREGGASRAASSLQTKPSFLPSGIAAAFSKVFHSCIKHISLMYCQGIQIHNSQNSALILRGDWLPKNMGQGHYGQQWTMEVPREKVKDESTDSCSRKWMMIQRQLVQILNSSGNILRMPKSWRRSSIFIYKCIAMSEAGKETRQGMNGQWWKCALWQVHNVARTHISELCGTFRHKWSSQAFLYPLFIFLRNFLFIFIVQIHKDYLFVLSFSIR